MNSKTLFKFSIILTCFLSILPWVIFGLNGPQSDGARLLVHTLHVYGFVDNQIFPFDAPAYFWTRGPSLFFAPLRYLLPADYFYWFGSLLMVFIYLFLLFFLYRSLLKHFQKYAALLIVLSYGANPFLQQMHYWWMTESVFTLSLIISFSEFFSFLKYKNEKHFYSLTFFLSLMVFSRSEAMAVCLFFGLLFLFFLISNKFNSSFLSYINIYFKNIKIKHVVLIFLIPFLLTLPFRIRNLYRFQSFSLNESIGPNITFYIQRSGLFSPANGPNSKLLVILAQRILDNPKDPLFETYKNRAENILKGQFNYIYPVSFYFAFFRDRKKANKFAVDIFLETIKAHKLKYLKAVIGGSLHYWLGPYDEGEFEISKNSEAIDFDSSHSMTQTIVPAVLGLNKFSPLFEKLYYSYRSVYSKFFNIMKKGMFFILPFFFIFLYFKRKYELFSILSILVIFQLFMTVSFSFFRGAPSQRYGISFEMFFALYFVIALVIFIRSLKSTSKI